MKQLDDAHPEFEPELLIHFVTQVSKALAAVSGKAKVMLRGHDLAARATETLQVGPPNDVVQYSRPVYGSTELYTPMLRLPSYSDVTTVTAIFTATSAMLPKISALLP